jgi:hypothetical protein
MDDATLALLSRHLDGDLAPDEAVRLEERLAREPELRKELKRLGEVSGWLADLAAGEEPPEALDALVTPLRVGPAPRPVIRPAFRWLAAAACVVIGVAVGVEVAQQHPPQAPAALARAEATRRPSGKKATKGHFQLQPLPSAPADEERPIGAADRLLASPPPEVVVTEMGVLDPVGPLEVAPEGEALREIEKKEIEHELFRDREIAVVTADSAGAPAPISPGQRAERAAAAPTGASRAARNLPERATLKSRTDKDDAAAVWAGLGSPAAATLELLVPDGVRTARAPVGDQIPPGEYRVVVQIDGAGRVVGVRTPATAIGDDRLPSSAATMLLGVVFEGVAEGEHDGVWSVPGLAPAPPTPED